MKVLFISQWYPHRNDPMAGLFVQKHAEAVSLFADVALLYVHPDEKLSKQHIQVTSDNGFKEIRVYYPLVGKSFIARILRQYQYFKAYKSGFDLLLKSWGKPDIIQANVFTRTAIVALIIKLIYKIPYLVIEHWTRYFREKTFRNLLHKKFSICAAKYASAVMPVTYHLKTNMERHGMKNTNYQIINNVVDDIYFEKSAIPVSKKIRILNVTCFDDAQKNLSGLLNVIHSLSTKRQDFEIYLVGEGVDFEKIKALSISLNLYNKVVFFTGMLIGKTLVELYQQSNLTVLFSNYENIPVVISESLVCGIPVVTTNVGGIAEHIDQSNGLLLEAKDEKALFTALDYMLDHYKEYNSVEIKQKAEQKYSYHSVGMKLFSIYSTILKNDQ
jgi:glycosyltransferase involved in cell wall biosynthesis